jgi:hypothetical protein
MHDPSGKQVTRWYRGEAVTPVALVGVELVGMGLTLLFDQGDSPLLLLWQRLGAAAPIPVGVYMIVFNRRAGIGVRSDGVIVRSCLGGKQWIPWSEIEQFEAIRMPRNRAGHVIAVICRGRKPLYTFGCWFDKTRKQSRIEKMRQVLRALEAERLAAIPETSTADPG